MILKKWKNFCLCVTDERALLPADAEPASSLFTPLVFPVWREPQKNRGWYAISSVDELFEEDGCSLLLPPATHDSCHELREFVAEHGACVLNTAFSSAYDFLQTSRKQNGLRLTLVGLGDVGGSLLTALKLLGKEIAELRIYDPNEKLCRRYEMELNQVLSTDGTPLPRVTVCPREQLFDCDLFLFAASRGVPPVGSQIQDVRMAQFALNREMLKPYAQQARQTGFQGLFCQISDPVDQLSRVVFWESNCDEQGKFDGKGLLPEQVQGFGLGVMAARAAYWAEKEGVEFSCGQVYGPHGAGLTVANDPVNYDKALSSRLTELTVTANLKIRDLGYKPYIAPALSSAAASILQLLRGQEHYGAVPIGATYFGCRSKMTPLGLCLSREKMHPELFKKLQDVYQALEEFPYD